MKELTVRDHILHTKQFTKAIDKPLGTITRDDIRQYLLLYNEKNPSTYRNILGSLKRFFRDYLNQGDIVESFKMPKIIFALKQLPTERELRIFYNALNLREKALFLLLSTTGLRISEALSLTYTDIDVKSRMVIPNNHRGLTKNSWITFYNSECEEIMKQYIEQCQPKDKLFPVSRNHVERIFKETSIKVGFRITPQTLRAWFCSEMGRLGMADRFIDAFCGRVPASVLARHYTDYSPEVLKEIYDRANLRVLS